MTSGFVESMNGGGIEHLTTLRPNGKKLEIGRYGAVTDSCTFRDFSKGKASASLFLYDNKTLVVETFRSDPDQWYISVPTGKKTDSTGGCPQDRVLPQG